MENSCLELRWRTMINEAEQKQRRKPIIVKLMSLEVEDWGYIYGEGSGLRISMEPEGISGFQPKKNSGITTCKSRDFEITAGNCLSWNAKICRFKNTIPQISPNQTYQDFHDLLNARFCLSIHQNKRALNVLDMLVISVWMKNVPPHLNVVILADMTI